MKLTAIQSHQETKSRYNGSSMQQNPVRLRQTPKYDTMHFGRFGAQESIVKKSGDFEYKEPLDIQDLSVRNGNATLGDVRAIGAVNVDNGFLRADNLTARAANADNLHLVSLIAGNANAVGGAEIKKYAIVETIKTGAHLEAGSLTAKTAKVGTHAKITGDAKVDLLKTGEQLRVGGTSEMRKVVSGGAVTLGKVEKLEEVVMRKRPNERKYAERTLAFTSDVVPEKIRVVLDDFAKLIVRAADESIMEKLEFFYNGRIFKNSARRKIPQAVIDRAVQFIKIAT